MFDLARHVTLLVYLLEYVEINSKIDGILRDCNLSLNSKWFEMTAGYDLLRNPIQMMRAES